LPVRRPSLLRLPATTQPLWVSICSCRLEHSSTFMMRVATDECRFSCPIAIGDARINFTFLLRTSLFSLSKKGYIDSRTLSNTPDPVVHSRCHVLVNSWN
jgi:hypothetical protein